MRAPWWLRHCRTTCRGPEPGVDQGRLPRYTWRDDYATLRERLDALGRRLGGTIASSWTTTPTSTARRRFERQSRSTARTRWPSHDDTDPGSSSESWSRKPRSSRPHPSLSTVGSAGSASTRAPRERSTTQASSTRRSASRTGRRLPLPYRKRFARSWATGCTAATSARRCARGTAGSRSAAPTFAPRAMRTPRSRFATGSSPTASGSSREFDRLYVPRNDPRWLRRNALVAAGNVGSAELAPVVERYLDDDDPMLAETAEWALERIAERTA